MAGLNRSDVVGRDCAYRTHVAFRKRKHYRDSRYRYQRPRLELNAGQKSRRGGSAAGDGGMCSTFIPCFRYRSTLYVLPTSVSWSEQPKLVLVDKKRGIKCTLKCRNRDRPTRTMLRYTAKQFQDGKADVCLFQQVLPLSSHTRLLQCAPGRFFVLCSTVYTNQQHSSTPAWATLIRRVVILSMHTRATQHRQSSIFRLQ